MSRLPLQVLVIPYRLVGGHPEFAVLRRQDTGDWQWIAGGVEQGETIPQAALRESAEEAGITGDLLPLDSTASIPACHFADAASWGPDVLVVPEHCFAVRTDVADLRLSPEHTEFRWVDFATAMSLLRWDSNRTALWELNERLRRRAR